MTLTLPIGFDYAYGVIYGKGTRHYVQLIYGDNPRECKQFEADSEKEVKEMVGEFVNNYKTCK